MAIRSEVELAAQPFLNDFKVQQAEETAAEAEAESGAGLHLEGERRVVEAKARDGGSEVFELGGVHREHAAEDHRLNLAEAGEGLGGGLFLVGDGVADGGVGHVLDLGGEEADFAGAKAIDVGGFRGENAKLVNAVGDAGVHQLDPLAGLHAPVDDAHEHDDAEVGVVPGVDQQGF